MRAVRASGQGGGVRCRRGADTVTSAETIAAVEEPIHATRCENGSPGCIEGVAGEAAIRCQTHDLWEELGRQIQMFLNGVTLADVVAGRVMGRAPPADHGGRLAAE